MSQPTLHRMLLRALWFATVATLIPGTGVAALNISHTPLFLGGQQAPLTLLVMGRDHKLYYEAYNDASDLDGDGDLEVRFKPSIDYYGYFNSYACYDYNAASKRFVPAAATPDKTCSGKWSGNFLNYLTMSRMDLLRKVLYGGYRSVDTATETVLERVYIPQDAHSWGKEYTSKAVDGFDIAKYTPLSEPTAGRRHLFANTTRFHDTSQLPLLRVVQNTQARVMEWVSKERLVAESSTSTGLTLAPTDYVVRVQVCSTTATETDCKRYPAGNFKPVGLLHQYGENDSMYFGLLTGSYQKNTSGGVLRKAMSSFKDEVDANNGRFTSTIGIVKTLDRLRITGFGSGYAYNDNCGWITTKPISEGECRMWGNPIAEMMYEGLRYFAGKAKPSNEFKINATGNDDAALGLPLATWNDPYDTTKGGFKECAKPFELVISDINPSFDTDQLPGSVFNSISTDLSGMNVATAAATITVGEPDALGLHFIGQSGTHYDGAPSAKIVAGLSSIRGLAPEEPTKQGGYYSASVAFHGKTKDLHSAPGDQKVETLAVTLASPLPKIEIPVAGRKVTLVPFAKSVAGFGISPDASKFQPTNQIVDFNVTQVSNTNAGNKDTSVNGGRPYYRFSINFEDVEQGADHDMDAIVEYTIAVTEDGKIRVALNSTYAAGSIVQHMGYVISGTSADGTYLEVRDKDTSAAADPDYFLDTPPGVTPGSAVAWQDRQALPLQTERVFTPSDTPAATLLKDPLWYAAKWGGFKDLNGNGLPDKGEWDSRVAGSPDNYFLVTNPGELNNQLAKAFSTLADKATSGSAAAVNGLSTRTATTAFQAIFDAKDWSGDLRAFKLNNNGTLGDIKWKASDQLKNVNPDSRVILTYDPKKGEGAPFRWVKLAPEQKRAIREGDGADDPGVKRVAYLRGDRTDEGSTYRKRSSLLGDVVNSAPLYVAAPSPYNRVEAAEMSAYNSFASGFAGRTPMVFVGANDGMLHGFNANTGAEILAFVPNAVFDNLPKLTKPAYDHEAFVDGQLTSAEVKLAKGGWSTVLVGGLGVGGKSVFALNITNPAEFKESNAKDLVLWEFTDANLGHVFGKPVVTRLRGGKNAVLFGSGYNAGDGSEPALYIVDIDTGSLIRRIPVSNEFSDNAIGQIRAVDLDDDNVTDIVFGGDLYGNLWEFDLTGSTSADWRVTRAVDGKPAPVFVARNAASQRQPITAAPMVRKHPLGRGLLVFFGTGKYLEQGDLNDTQVQSLYAVWLNDNLKDGALEAEGVEVLRSQLLAQDILLTATDAFKGKHARVTTKHKIDWSTHKGWYIDLDTEAGERAHQSPFLRGGRVIFATLTPSADTCAGGGSSWLYELDFASGSRLKTTPFDYNDDRSFNTSDHVTVNWDENGDDKVDSKDRVVGSAIRLDDTGIAFLDGGSVLMHQDHELKLLGTSVGGVQPVGESGAVTPPTTWRQLQEP